MDDEQVLARVRRLVDDGEYLDDLLGRPGEALKDATTLQLAPGVLQFGSARGRRRWWRQEPVRPELSTARRMYRRGSQAHLDAKAAGLIDPLPPLRPATPAAVSAAERAMGATFPPLLRRLYLEVGNGGFGPGYGILALEDARAHGDGRDAVDVARRFRNVAQGAGPLLPICDWGCGIVSLVELGTPGGRIWGDDPNCAPHEYSTYCQDIGLAEWLDRWVDRRLYQPAVIEKPDGTYRGATIEELEAWAAEFED